MMPAFILVVALLAALTACGDASGSTPTPSAPTPSTPTFTPDGVDTRFSDTFW